MTKTQAIHALSDGHSIYTVVFAQAICKALGVAFPVALVKKYYSDPATMAKGLTMAKGKEGMEGVYSLHLSATIAGILGVADKACQCLGRGSQARAYSNVIALALNIKEAENETA